jgi:hypothetical protein
MSRQAHYENGIILRRACHGGWNDGLETSGIFSAVVRCKAGDEGG